MTLDIDLQPLHTYSHICTLTWTCIHTRTDTHSYIHIHRYTHTHTRMLSLSIFIYNGPLYLPHWFPKSRMSRWSLPASEILSFDPKVTWMPFVWCSTAQTQLMFMHLCSHWAWRAMNGPGDLPTSESSETPCSLRGIAQYINGAWKDLPHLLGEQDENDLKWTDQHQL